jgi:hypothetical protein
MTGAECKSIKQKAARTRMAYAATSRPTPRRGLFFQGRPASGDSGAATTCSPPRIEESPDPGESFRIGE